MNASRVPFADTSAASASGSSSGFAQLDEEELLDEPPRRLTAGAVRERDDVVAHATTFCRWRPYA